jgi:hypothetical protein
MPHLLRVALPAPVLAFVAAILTAPAQQPATRHEDAHILGTFTLPELRLQNVLEAALHSVVEDDRNILLGSSGSDLWHGPEDAPDEFWMLCDRGPNRVVHVDGAPRRTFLVPQYTPLILHLRTTKDRLAVLGVIPITGASGKPVTGLSNLEGRDEVPYDATGRTRLPYNQSGLDPEGLVRQPDGEFWIAEEYGPSLVHVDPTGRVLLRVVPAGVDLPAADYPVAANLPAIYSHRKPNRGFEGLGLTRDKTTLLAIEQSALLVPDKATGKGSRAARILCLDARTGRPTREYVYRVEPVAEFDPHAKPHKMKIGGLAVVEDGTLLVIERTDEVARVFAADCRHATDLLGSEWDDPTHSPSLESLPDPAAAGVLPLQKRMVADLTALPGVPGKIEGIAVVDEHTFAIANDDDFDVGAVDAAAHRATSGTRSRLWLISVPTPLSSPAH